MKVYRYELKNDTGYRLSVNKSNLLYFKKIVYDGFNIRFSTNNGMEYEIDQQLIRKIKLNKINKQITRTESAILELLERSIEHDIETNKFNSYYGSYSSSYSYSSYSSYNDIEEKKEIRERNKYQSKVYNQKAKQYENKARFRK